jgi:hypothetical protein
MKYKLSKIRGKTAYTIREIKKLLKVNRKTLYRWFEEGLTLLDPVERPILVMGYDIKVFIKFRRESRKVKLKDNELYCLRCRKAVLAKEGSVIIKKTGKNIGHNGRCQEIVSGKCECCGGLVSRLI